IRLSDSAQSRIRCFFFQAEDGIRDGHVTGVQTCALPISSEWQARDASRLPAWGSSTLLVGTFRTSSVGCCAANPRYASLLARTRSEERRVGKECRSWWGRYHAKKNELVTKQH